MIIAHQGASGTFPAQTRGSYEAAIEEGADVIGCDLAVSKDRKFLCLHDEYLRNWLLNENSSAESACKGAAFLISS